MNEFYALVRTSKLPSPEAARTLRESAGIGPGDFADALGVSRWALWRWENGRTSPRGEVRRHYCRALTAIGWQPDA